VRLNTDTTLSNADPNRLVRPVEAARFLSVTRGALDNWRSRGTGPAYVRLGPRCVRYKVGELLAWIERQSAGPRTPDRAEGRLSAGG